eukprot:TRINITY_DN364_c0_g1_i1.p1 TRINITY_DN364_c0_g1~~TRINITY_DN364_c0_g1_i1.p1  ORF type:complete len:151 (-),score=51.19 TRINITY_DN364_c0_g1_i1:34-429(-)
MNNNNTLPIQSDFIAENSYTLTDGLPQLKSLTLETHPVEKLQQNIYQDKKMKKEGLRHLFGQHMPMRLALEESVMSQSLRLPGMDSSYFGLEILTGQCYEIGFEDFLDMPEFSEQNVDLHREMEVKLGIQL